MKRFVGLLLLLASCTKGPLARSETTPIVTEAAAWSAAPVDLNPLSDHRPVDDDCPEGSWGSQGATLEVETGLCHYAWLEQPLPDAVLTGAVLSADLWHTGLDAAEPAEAHVAVLLGDRVVREAWAAIPSDPTLWEITAALDEPLPADAPVGLHLHNHGDNAWTLGPVTLE